MGSADLINHRVMRVGPGAGTRVSADTVMWTFLFDSYRKITSEGTGDVCSSYPKPDGSCENESFTNNLCAIQ